MTKPISVILILLLFSFGGCHKKTGNSPIIASVNSNEVQLGDFHRFISSKLGELSNDEMVDSLRSQMLDELLVRRVVIAAAENIKLEISDTEIAQAMQDDPHKKSSTTDE